MAPPPRAAASAPVATLAGFWIRFAAYLVDSLILGVVLVPLFVVAGIFFRPSADNPGAAMGGILLIQLVVTALSVAYVLYFWSTSGATPGKKALRLKIVRVDGVHPLGLGTAGMRLVGYLASSAILCIGYLMIGFSAEKRGLHDLIAKTRVIRLG